MLNRVMVILFSLLFLSQANADERSFAKYKVGDIVHTLPVNETNAFIMGIRDIGKALKKCQSKTRALSNPLINRDSLLSVAIGRNGCRYNYLREGNWKYQCTLPEKVSIELGDAMEKASLKSGMVLGDFTETEKNILFDSRFCSEISMK
jgi:hypothetical protein